MPYTTLTTGEIVPSAIEVTAPVTTDPVAEVELPPLPPEESAVSTPIDPIISAEAAAIAWNRYIFYQYGCPIILLENPEDTTEKIYIIWFPENTYRLKGLNNQFQDAAELKPIHVAFEGSSEQNYMVQLDGKDPFSVKRKNPTLLDVYTVNDATDLDLALLKVSVGKKLTNPPVYFIKALDDVGNVLFSGSNLTIEDPLRTELDGVMGSRNIGGPTAEALIKKLDEQFPILKLVKGIGEYGDIGTYKLHNFGSNNDSGYTAIANAVTIWKGDDPTITPFISETRIDQDPTKELIYSATGDWTITPEWDNSTIEYVIGHSTYSTSMITLSNANFIWFVSDTEPKIKLTLDDDTEEIYTPTGFSNHAANGQIKSAAIWLDKTADELVVNPDLLLYQGLIVSNVRHVLAPDTLPAAPDNPWKDVFNLDNWTFKETTDKSSITGVSPNSLAYVKFTWTETGYDMEAQGLTGDSWWTFRPIPANTGLPISTLQTGGNEGKFTQSATADGIIGIEIQNYKITGSKKFFKAFNLTSQWEIIEITRFGVPAYEYRDPNSDNKILILQEDESRLHFYVKGSGDWTIKTPGSTDIEMDVANFGYQSNNFNGYIEVWDPNTSRDEQPVVAAEFNNFAIASNQFFKIPTDWYILGLNAHNAGCSISLSLDHTTTYGEISFYPDKIFIFLKKDAIGRNYIHRTTFADATTIKGYETDADPDGLNTVNGDNPVMVEIWMDMNKVNIEGEPDIIVTIPPTIHDEDLDSLWQEYIARKLYLATDKGKLELATKRIEELRLLISKISSDEIEHSSTPISVDENNNVYVVGDSGGHINLSK